MDLYGTNPANSRSMSSKAAVSEFAGDFYMTAVIVVILDKRRVFIKEDSVGHTMDIVAVFIGSDIVVIVITDKGEFLSVFNMDLVCSFDTEKTNAVIDINNVCILVIVFIKADDEVCILTVRIID